MRNWNQYEVWLALGWILSTVYLDVIADEFGVFPILAVGGLKEGGKTSLCEILTAFHGTHDQVNNAEETTRVSIGRHLNYFSNLSVWIDEYRPTVYANDKWDSFLRSVYNRQGASKAERGNTSQIRKVPVYGSLILSGEASPSESALMTRCIMINLDKYRLVGSEWNWLCKHRSKFSAMYYQVAKQRKEKLREEF